MVAVTFHRRTDQILPGAQPAHELVACSVAPVGWLFAGGLGSEGGGVLGDQGAEALQQLQQPNR
jgi:hypothetical protein